MHIVRFEAMKTARMSDETVNKLINIGRKTIIGLNLAGAYLNGHLVGKNLEEGHPGRAASHAIHGVANAAAARMLSPMKSLGNIGLMLGATGLVHQVAWKQHNEALDKAEKEKRKKSRSKTSSFWATEYLALRA